MCLFFQNKTVQQLDSSCWFTSITLSASEQKSLQNAISFSNDLLYSNPNCSLYVTASSMCVCGSSVLNIYDLHQLNMLAIKLQFVYHSFSVLGLSKARVRS